MQHATSRSHSVRKASLAALCVYAVVALLATGLGASGALAMTADELIAKHVEARGGDAWKSVAGLTLEGDFTAFSKVHPFVQYRTGDGHFYMDHILDDKQVVLGYDGVDPWWVNGWFGTWATRVTGLDRSVFMQDVDFPNVWFHIDDTYQVEYKGEGDLDGMSSLMLHLTRPDGWEETWHFDPDSYLELGRETTGSDFGRPSEQLTIFDDFRDVDGLQIPHYVESQWYTRNRVWEVHKATVNGTIDNSLFTMPGPTGMDLFSQLAGTWNVKVESRQQPQAPFTESERTAEATSRLRGAMLELAYTTEDARNVMAQLSYDRFNEMYRLATIDDTTTYMDVQEGKLEEGVLTVSNQETSTYFETFGFTIKERTTFKELSADAFQVEVESSMDGGENWFVSSKLSFERQP